ncbi:MAG: GNAT family N-acetyltransferase [Rhodobacteraceae bacterium]|nr:GNAT family N-acetyltransferase [Paracoccaceae bacterium]
MNIQIRQISIGDADMVATMIADLLDEFAPGAGPDAASLIPTARAVLAQPTVTALLAEADGLPAGLAMLNDCAAVYAGGAFGEITELYVRPDLRSQGIAAQLLAEAGRIGRIRGWRRIEVGAPEQPVWARTLAFYRREGFVEVGPRLKMPL